MAGEQKVRLTGKTVKVVIDPNTARSGPAVGATKKYYRKKK